MPDIRLISVIAPDVMTFDWLQTPTGLLDETQQLASAITVALNTDATADVSDVLPDPRSSDRRGWWGDLDAQAIWNGWPIGSKLWLLARAKIVDSGAREGATTVRVKNYIMAALQPFIDNKICSQISVAVTLNNIRQITAQIIIYRGPKTAIQLNYEPLWDELSNSSAPVASLTTSIVGGSPSLDYSVPDDSEYLPLI
jgi:phage gp46-like protein